MRSGSMTSFPLVTGAVTSLDKRIGDRSLMIGLAEHTEQYQRGYARFTLGRGDASYSGNGMTCSLQIWRISPGRFCGTAARFLVRGSRSVVFRAFQCAGFAADLQFDDSAESRRAIVGKHGMAGDALWTAE